MSGPDGDPRHNAAPALGAGGADAVNDEMIPFSMGERLYAAAAEPKESAWVGALLAAPDDRWTNFK